VSLPYRTRVKRVALSAIPVLFCLAALLQWKIDAQAATISQANEELILQSPNAIKELSMGYDGLLGDIYWTRAVQYYGREVQKPKPDFHLLWPLLNVATTLDPKLEVAYHFGAIFLSETGHVGAGRTDLAVKLVKKGIAANPDVWQLGTDLGFLYYWRLKDYSDAAAAYLQTSRIPNSPPWIKMMAARVAQTGGSIQTSQMIWGQIYDSTKDPSVKKRAYEQLQGLRAQEDLIQLGNISEEYKQHVGHYPASEEELRAAGYLEGIPVDPAGFPYEIAPDGKAHLNPRTTFQMPAEPKVYSAPSTNPPKTQAAPRTGTQVQ
jgi:tetratricopeptide (TPR) repeat protein